MRKTRNKPKPPLKPLDKRKPKRGTRLLLGNKQGELTVFEFVHRGDLVPDWVRPIYIGRSREETAQNLKATILSYCKGEPDVSPV